MTDMPALNPESEETPVPSGTEETFPEPPASTGKKRSKWTTIYRVIAISIGGIAVLLMFIVYSERPKVISAIDEFMTAMKDGNVDKAYELMSDRSKTYYTSYADVEQMHAQNPLVFSSYQELEVTELLIQKAFADSPSVPQGNVATVEGKVYFTGGIVEPFTATLEKEEGAWRIFSFFIGPPPDESSP